jgi:small subunit ribosomal protein S4
MARNLTPIAKQSRREGTELHPKAAKALARRNFIPGQHGQSRRSKPSDYSVQLREKQKVKHMYGVLERQFRKMFEQAKVSKGNTGDQLLEYMERRLDNVVYRMGFAPTRTSARQFVSHGHVLINGKKVSIPSYLTQMDEVITMKPKALEIPAVKKQLEDKGYKPPMWVERKGPVGKIVRLPNRADVMEDITMQLIVEHYSR